MEKYLNEIKVHKKLFGFDEIENTINNLRNDHNTLFGDIYRLKDIKLDIVIDKKPEIDNKLIKIKNFKSIKAVYYYNPEIFIFERLIKLENKIYINYHYSHFLEQLPSLDFIYIKFNNPFDKSKHGENLDILFIKYNNIQ